MKIKIGDQEVNLDPKHLEIDEVSLNDFLKSFAGLYNYYNTLWAEAQYLNALADDAYDLVFHDKFRFYKESGAGSDKLVEAKVMINEDVQLALKQKRSSKYLMQLLFVYLRAMDKAHDNALNLGYNIRKEMDKLFPQVVRGPHLEENLDHEISKMFDGSSV